MSTNGQSKFINNAKGKNKSLDKSRSNELIDFKRLYSILRPYFWLIILSAIFGAGLAYYYTNEYMLPVYRSSSTMIIEDSPENFSGGNEAIDNIISNSYNLNTNQTIESEILFLKSRELSVEVAKQVEAEKYLPNQELHPLLWTEYPEDSTNVSQSTLAGRIRNGLTVETSQQGSNILSISFESYSPQEASRIVNYALNEYQEITAERKRASAESALEYLTDQKEKWKNNLEETENELSEFMNNQNLVAIESQTSNLVNTVSALESQKQDVTIQLESVRSGIENHEQQLQAIKPGLGERNSQAIGPRISRYQEELANLETERLILISNNPQLEQNQNSEPILQSLNKRINDLQSEIRRLTNDLLSDDGEGYLGLLSNADGNFTQEISNIQAQLTRLLLEESQLEAQLGAINNRLQDNQAFLDRVPENQKRLQRLRRQVSIYEEMYLTVNNKENEVRVWDQTRSKPGTIVDYASVSNSPVKPQKMTWLLGGLMLGLFLPVLIILLKEFTNNKINSLQELNDREYPLLGVFYDHSLLRRDKTKELKTSNENSEAPKITDDLVLYHYGMSPVAEAYRGLVSKILYSHPANSIQTILVTSANESEGKTTVVSNMAIALNEIGKRVLIIDCDMRRPNMHRFFSISRGPGIMEYLFEDYSKSDVIKNTFIPGLDILTTGGKQPARPYSVIGNESFRNLILDLKKKYDFILLDTAPFGIVGDIAPLIHLTDGVIVNSKFRSTKGLELDYTIDQLEQNSAKILGLTLSKYNPSKSIDEAEIKGLYRNKYNSYYDYHEA